MSPDRLENDASPPPVLRQRDILKTIGADASRLLGDVDDHAVIECRLLAGYGEYTCHVVRVDGTAESVRTPPSVKDCLEELREQVMYTTETGTWLSARFMVNRDGGVDGDFNYDAEPAWSHSLDPELYIQELRALPRDRASVPAWLHQKIDFPAGES